MNEKKISTILRTKIIRKYSADIYTSLKYTMFI